jgi:hypothetical protein
MIRGGFWIDPIALARDGSIAFLNVWAAVSLRFG